MVHINHETLLTVLKVNTFTVVSVLKEMELKLMDQLHGDRFDNSNTKRLMESMSEEEKSTFGFDVGSIDWRDYITNVHIPGLRRHVMKGRGM